MRGISKIVGGDPYIITIAANDYIPQTAKVNDSGTQVTLENIDNGLVKLTLTRSENSIVEWTVRFQ